MALSCLVAGDGGLTLSRHRCMTACDMATVKAPSLSSKVFRPPGDQRKSDPSNEYTFPTRFAVLLHDPRQVAHKLRPSENRLRVQMKKPRAGATASTPHALIKPQIEMLSSINAPIPHFFFAFFCVSTVGTYGRPRHSARRTLIVAPIH